MDCLIIGAGLIGASLSWRLGQRGYSVTLVDAGAFCSEASHAGAGMLSPEGEHFPSPIWAQRARESLRLYPNFVAELERESGLKIDYAVCGAIEGDRHFPGEAIVDPRDLAAALRQAFHHYDISLIEHRSIASLSTSTSLVTSLHSPAANEGERVALPPARASVIAAGAWSGNIIVNDQPLPATIPVKGYLLGYQSAPKLGPIRRDGHTYILQRSSGYTIAGSTEQTIGYDRGTDSNLVADLQARAAALWPPLAELKPADIWSGLRPGTASGHIYTERWKQHPIWLAYGHYRNGILLAPWTAEHLANDISAWLLDTRHS